MKLCPSLPITLGIHDENEYTHEAGRLYISMAIMVGDILLSMVIFTLEFINMLFGGFLGMLKVYLPIAA